MLQHWVIFWLVSMASFAIKFKHLISIIWAKINGFENNRKTIYAVNLFKFTFDKTVIVRLLTELHWLFVCRLFNGVKLLLAYCVLCCAVMCWMGVWLPGLIGSKSEWTPNNRTTPMPTYVYNTQNYIANIRCIWTLRCASLQIYRISIIILACRISHKIFT